MNDILPPLETLWERLLSRDAELIRNTFEQIAPEDRQTALEHLQRMASEPGWHLEQRLSAQAALETLGNQKGKPAGP